MIFSNLVNGAWEQYSVTRYNSRRLGTENVKYLAPGTYTMTAVLDPDPDVGKDITCYAIGEKNDGTMWTYPANGESAVPMSLTVSEVSDVRFFFGYEGFRTAPYGEGDEIALSAVSAVKCGDPNTPDRDIYESAVMPPDEISDSDVLAQGISAKSSVTLQIFPDFEAWGFCRRGITLVRIIDLDRAEDRTIFKGRVSAVSDIMENGGAVRQDVICVSAADFLEDTAFTDGIEPQSLSYWLLVRCTAHNNQVELARRCTFTVSGSATVSAGTEYLCKTNFEMLNDVLTGGKYLRENGEIVKYEWRERYHNDIVYIDTAAKLGTDMDTPFEIGDNLIVINIDRDTSGGIYTSVMAVSGVNADGYRARATAANGAMIARYHNGRQLVIVNDSIYFTGPGGREYNSGGGWNWHVTPAVEAMEAALQEYANQEAAKLSEPPIRITLTAADLAQMGFSGYEPFAVGNSHPLVYPPGGYFGQRVRITGIRRRLSDGRIEQITIAQGQQPGNQVSGALSWQLARLEELNRRVDDETTKQTEIIETKIDESVPPMIDDVLYEVLDGATIIRMTKAEYDALGSYDDTVFYNVDNNGTNELYIGADHISSGGGGGTIETAAILSSEQMVYWAPDHELVPVDFRGGAHIYYSQPPAKIVIQKQHAIVGTPTAALVATSDLYEEIVFEFSQTASTGKQKLKFYIAKMRKIRQNNVDMYVIDATITCSQVEGGSEIIIGNYYLNTISLPADTTQWSLGLLISVSQLTSSGNDPVNPTCTIYAALKAGQSFGILGVPNITGSFFNPGFTGEFLNDAERNFALGVAGIVEPVPEQSGGGEGE